MAPAAPVDLSGGDSGQHTLDMGAEIMGDEAPADAGHDSGPAGAEGAGPPAIGQAEGKNFAELMYENQ